MSEPLKRSWKVWARWIATLTLAPVVVPLTLFFGLMQWISEVLESASDEFGRLYWKFNKLRNRWIWTGKFLDPTDK